MWIFLRLVMAATAFAMRHLPRPWQSQPEGHVDDRPYYVSHARDRFAQLRAFSVGTRAETSAFRLHPESWLDRFLKGWGLAAEFQTGDPSFDERVYLACDHPGFLLGLRDAPAVRGRIVELLEQGYRHVHSDGSTLWATKKSRQSPATADILAIVRLGAALEEMSPDLQRRLVDPYARRIVLIEATVWSLVAYAAVAFVESYVVASSHHLDGGGLVPLGVATGAVLGLGFLALTFLLLRGSALGHRVVIESGMLLALSVPVAGLQLVSDANRGLDGAEPIRVVAPITAAEMVEHRGRRGRHWYSYHVGVDVDRAEPALPALPRSIQVDAELFEDARRGGRFEMLIGPGWLGHPWYRSTRVIPARDAW